MIKYNKLSILIILTLVFLTTLSCKDIKSHNSGKRHIAATHEVGANIAKVIGGDFVTVTTIIKHGSDPHSYKTSENDMIRAAGSEIILYNGYFLEGRLAEILRKNDKTSSTISLISGIEKDKLIKSNEKHFIYNPHFWMDINLYTKSVRYATDKLIDNSPINERLYRRNEDEYLLKLKLLDEEVRSILSKVPAEKRILVTAHNAFEYFGKAYNFTTYSLQGIDTSYEIRADDITKFIDFITNNKVKVIFTETTTPAKIYDQVLIALKNINYDITVAGPLYSDVLIEDASHEDAYSKTMLHNARTIVNAISAYN